MLRRDRPLPEQRVERGTAFPDRRLTWVVWGMLLIAIVASETIRRAWLGDRPPPRAQPLETRPASFYRLSWGALELPPTLEAGRSVPVR